jgi:WD40 repeat protein/tetratricopeptide (TPR) repeat protein
MHRLRIAATAQMCPRPVHLLPHRGPVVNVVVNPDGKRLLTVSGGEKGNAREARVWDLDSGKPITEPMTMPRGIQDAYFSPDGNWVVLTCQGQRPISAECRAWNAVTGQPVTRLFALPDGTPLKFSPDSRRLLVLTDGNVQVWDLAGGKQALSLLQRKVGARGNEPLLSGRNVSAFGGWLAQVRSVTGDLTFARLAPTTGIYVAEYSSDGKRILTKQGEICQLWDAESGQPLGLALPSEPFGRHAFSPDGATLLLFYFDRKSPDLTQREGTLLFVDTATGRPIGSPRTLGVGVHLFFSPDGKTALLRDERRGVELKFINPMTGQETGQTWREKGSWQIGQKLSPDGQHVLLRLEEGISPALAGNRRAYQVFEIWLAGSKPSSDSRYLMDKGALLWHPHTGQRISLMHIGKGATCEFSPDSRKLLVRRQQRRDITSTALRLVEIYDVESGDLLVSAINHQDQETQGALSFDSQRLLTWGGTEARAWDAATGQPLTPVLPHGDRVTAAAFLPDQARFITASADGLVRLWGPSPAQPPTARIRPGGYIRRFRLSPDGSRLLLSSISPKQSPIGTQRLWDVSQTRPLTAPLPNYWARQLGAFAEEGRLLVTWDEHGVQLWDATSGRPLPPGIQTADQVAWVAVSRRGRRVAVVERKVDSNGRTRESWVRIWDGATGKPVTTPFAKVTSQVGKYGGLEFSPDGTRLLLFGAHDLQMWDTERLRPLTPVIPCRRHLFSDDGRRLLTTSDDKVGKVWDVSTGAAHGDVALERFVTPRTGARVILTGAGQVAQVWDARTAEPLSAPLKPVHGVRDARLVANGRFAVTLGQPITGTVYQSQLVPTAGASPEHLIVSELILWDARTGEPLVPALPVATAPFGLGAPGPGYGAPEIQASQDGRKLAFCSDLFTCDVWELPRDERPVEELALLAQALSGRRVDASGGTSALDPKQWLDLRARFPEARPRPFDLLHWYSEQAEVAETTGDWETARRHLDRLIAAQPDVWMHYRRRGRADGNLHDWEAGLRDNTRAIKLGADIPIVWHNRGYSHLALGHFKEAGDDLEKAAGMKGVWPLTWFNLAEARAFQGDAAGYRRACTGLLSNFGRYSLSNVVWNCCLAPGGVADGNVLIRLAEQNRSTAAERDRPKGHNADALAGAGTALGAALYRAAKYQEAITVLTAYKDAHGAYDWLFLAMAHHHLGQKERAEKYLNESIDWIDLYADDSQKGPFYTRSAAWNRRQQLRLLSEEAEKLILGPSPSAWLAFALSHHEKTLRLRKARLGPHHPDTLKSMWSLGDTCARLGRWDQALAAIGQAAELAPDNHWYVYHAAALHLRAGDVAAYRRACRAMLERFGDTDQPDVADRAAKTCLLASGAVTDLDRVLKLADRAVTGTEKQRWHRWFVFGKALAEYRAGRHAQAVEWLSGFAPNPGGGNIDAAAFAVLAMAQLRLGRVEAARAALASGEKIVAEKLPDPAAGRPFGGDWDDWLRCQILLGEARQKLKKKSGQDPEAR